ncbi:MAG TPA: response regulator [Acidimicrobiia bacterium]|nr:response regulator [Acidimicrobiia bacterium]
MNDRRRVLIVEDDPTLGALLKGALEAAGHEVAVATSRSAALVAVPDLSPDVICVDLDLPDGTGWQLIDELEKRRITPPMVIVATAGLDASRSRRRPGTFVLTKPFPIDSLLRLLSGQEPAEI